MTAQNMAAHAVDPDGKSLYRVGGIAALVFGIAYIAIIGLYVPMGARPNEAERLLAYMAGNTTAWWAILWLSVLTDLLLVPIALALYLALKGTSRIVMLVATAFVGLFVVLDLALTWINIGTLVTLSGSYAAASDAQRAALVAAATYPSMVVSSNLVFVYNSLTLAVGILMTGLAMWKGTFGKGAAYVALATGVLGIAAVLSSFFSSTVSGMTIILASILTTVWYLLVGYKLLRLGR